MHMVRFEGEFDLDFDLDIDEVVTESIQLKK